MNKLLWLTWWHLRRILRTPLDRLDDRGVARPRPWWSRIRVVVAVALNRPWMLTSEEMYWHIKKFHGPIAAGQLAGGRSAQEVQLALQRAGGDK